MSLDKKIVELLADGPRIFDGLVSDTGAEPQILKMRLGSLVTRGKIRLVDGRYHLHNGAGRPRKKRAKPEAVPEPEAFDVAVWLDGSVCIRGATASADGSMVIQAEDAVRMACHILKLPAPKQPEVAA